MQRLFIYGTLAPGRENHNVVEGIPGSWEAATLKGILLHEGWGADMGYPGIIPSKDGDEVEGYILCSEYLSEYWKMLDEFEGDAYKRMSVVAKTNSGDEVEAYVYALNSAA
jgi:gamma-glutamylcyclotransferase (GGCT)/AIG2-like uncharacterized protein YtfP